LKTSISLLYQSGALFNSKQYKYHRRNFELVPTSNKTEDLTIALILAFPALLHVLFGLDEPFTNFRFDAIVSADAFENLKPAPDIFLAASKNLGVGTNEVIYLANQIQQPSYEVSEIYDFPAVENIYIARFN
jgi:hypothetical protein